MVIDAYKFLNNKFLYAHYDKHKSGVDGRKRPLPMDNTAEKVFVRDIEKETGNIF